MRKILFAVSLATLSLPAFAADSLTIGKALQGHLAATDRSSDSGGRSRDYSVRLQADQLVAISAKSTDFDTVLILFKPDGDKLAENDDREGGGTDSLLVTSVPETGTYTLRINSLPMGEGHLGAYTLRVSAIDDN